MIRVPARLALGLCAGLLLLGRPVLAATPQTDVGSEDERLRRPKALEVPARPQIPVELPPEGELPSAAVGVPPIPVARVVIDGATKLPASTARELTRPVEGETVSLDELRRVAQAITRWYRGRGYITSRALVPAQSIDQGVVTIRVIEGRAGQVRVEGNRRFSTRLLRRYLRVEPGEIVWLPRLEEALRALNANLDRTVKLVLAPGAEPETTDVILQVTDRLPVHASYTVDTLGTRATGEIRHLLSVSHTNLTGRDDQLAARGILTEFGGLKAGAVSYLVPLSPSGIAATLDVSAVTSSIGADLKSLKAHGHAETISPGLLVPLIRRLSWELDGIAGFDWKRIRTFLDETASSKDDLRVSHAGMQLLEQDGQGRSLVTHELRVGLGDVLGGSHPKDIAASRGGAGGSFVVWGLSAVRIQRAVFGTSLLMRGSLQVASNRLVPAEQFRLGGFESVRGYPEGEYLADYGYQTSVEWRIPVDDYLPWPSSDAAFISRLRRPLTLAGFWDFGEGFLRGARVGEDKDARLSGLGFGLRLRPTEESLLQADVAWAVGDPDSEKNYPHFYLIGRVGF